MLKNKKKKSKNNMLKNKKKKSKNKKSENKKERIGSRRRVRGYLKRIRWEKKVEENRMGRRRRKKI